MLITALRRRRDLPWAPSRIASARATRLPVIVTPLCARRAKRFHFGGAWILHQSLVLGRFNMDQLDLAFGVVMKAPPVVLRQRRHAKVRVALAQELRTFFRPAWLRDVMKDGVHPKGNVFFGVRVRMLGEQLVLD